MNAMVHGGPHISFISK